MGLLSKGTPLPWEEAQQYADHVRRNGIQQLLHIYDACRGRHADPLVWGDEIEYMLLELDDGERSTARLSLRADAVLQQLQLEEEQALKEGRDPDGSWKPEYARYMLEGTPGVPYEASWEALLTVEANMRKRRQLVERHLRPNEFLATLTCFPALGCKRFLEPHYEPGGEASHSMFIPDEAIAPHARFRTLTENIRKRRGKKVAINVPIFHDRLTPRPFVESFPPAPFPQDGAQDALPDHIYMDAMCFGMGCSCLQITFQASDIHQARHLYDQLAVLAPIMLALTAASPIFRGFLADVDCRWNVIAKSVDDRTPEEMGLTKPSGSTQKHPWTISKSRYDSIDMFISEQISPTSCSSLNDVDVVHNEQVYGTLRKHGMDELLAKHFAHLFIRDPLVLYRELLQQENGTSSDHFENIQSTNWQTVRFKPPPPGCKIGWRVEFRTMEIQMTEFENAAFAVFMAIMVRVILDKKLNFYMPMSKVQANMQTAQKRDAVRAERFHFSTAIFEDPSSHRADSIHELSMNELMNGIPPGTNRQFVGLVPLVSQYLDRANLNPSVRSQLNQYVNLVQSRASGTSPTAARWIRDFVGKHPEYKSDSRVHEKIVHDLCAAIRTITKNP